MELAQHEDTSSRRSFIGQVGKMVAAGLGLGLVATRSSWATSDACAIFCNQSCGTSPCYDADTCGGSSPNCFHCVTQCGYSFGLCSSHACSGFCYSQNAC